MEEITVELFDAVVPIPITIRWRYCKGYLKKTRNKATARMEQYRKFQLINR